MTDLNALQQQTRVISLVNNKGGVGKTTLTANIGGLLGASGWRVLLIDLDHQGNLGLDYGYRGEPDDDNGRALAMALQYGVPITPVRVRENVDVLIGGTHLEGAVRALTPIAGAPDPRLAVAGVISRVLETGEYDIVLIDCPPSNDILQTAAVTASKYVLIPVKTDRASLDGLALTAQRLEAITDVNPDVDLLGIVLFDAGTGAARVRDKSVEKVVDALTDNSDDSTLREEARRLVFPGYLRHAEATAQMTRDKGRLVSELDEEVRKGPKWFERLRAGAAAEPAGPTSAKSVADDLQAITEELVRRIYAREGLQTEGETAHV